jgi:hypothetical protein
VKEYYLGNSIISSMAWERMDVEKLLGVLLDFNIPEELLF